MLRNKSAEFNHIYDFFMNLNDKCDMSYDGIKDLKITGGLDYYFESNGIDKDFKTILDRFVSVLNDNSLEEYPYSKKFYANALSDLTSCFCYCVQGYAFGAYLNKNIIIFPENNKLFFRFPLFFKSACEKFNIEPYASMSEEDIKLKLSEYVDLECLNNPNARADRRKPEYEERVNSFEVCEPIKYEEYNNIKNIKDFSLISDSDFIKYMSIAAEEEIFNDYKSIPDNIVFWVSQHGDGFGYDILVLNKLVGKENIVEVKSSYKYESFELTENEYKTMLKSVSSPKTNYIIYKLFYNRSSMLPEKKQRFIYDKSAKILIDIDDPNYGCQILPYRDEKNKPKYLCTRRLIKDIESDNKKINKLRISSN